MKSEEMYETMMKLHTNNTIKKAFGVYMAIPFERVLRFSESEEPPLAIDLGTGGGDACGGLISMLVACKFLGGKVYTVDRNHQPDSIKLIEEYGLSDIVEFLVFDDISEEAKEFFKDMRPNVIFVDTSHDYEHTGKELEFYSKILSNKGFMIFHDSDAPQGYGVTKALVKFLENNESFVLEDHRKKNNGIVVIKKVKEVV